MTLAYYLAQRPGAVFSMQVVMNKYFLLDAEKKFAQIRIVVFEKNAKTAHFNSEKMTSPS